ncbi:MAG: pirin family protein [Pyrinomonadaceae bacterium]|nr:pirin family protein [Pyrinomonadaceae bacterium]
MHKALKHRGIKRLWAPMVTTDGAGVTLRRSIGTGTVSHLDPFLLFDHFGSSNPEEYIAGFPMHPHRGIQTVTYMLKGKIRHRDSVGNSGVIEAGGVQWMTAGSGILHEEMPEMTEGRLEGFQLWVNLRSNEKMSEPGYQEFSAVDVPLERAGDGVKVKVIAGKFDGLEGPVRGVSGAPAYFDISIKGNKAFEFELRGDRAVFGYVYRGGLKIESFDDNEAQAPEALEFKSGGDAISLRATEDGASVLVIAGSPIREPIARYGPFVMNTEEEIKATLEELRNGTFIKDD